jgi:hypothetical protein
MGVVGPMAQVRELPSKIILATRVRHTFVEHQYPRKGETGVSGGFAAPPSAQRSALCRMKAHTTQCPLVIAPICRSLITLIGVVRHYGISAFAYPHHEQFGVNFSQRK